MNYNDEVEVGPVDLTIPAGGITALVGPNGAGKSTLLTMIGRLLRMDAGSIEIAGYDVVRTPSKDLARIVSILRQENHFVTRPTVRQLVGFSRFPHSKGRLTRADEEFISQWPWFSPRTPTMCCSTSRFDTPVHVIDGSDGALAVYF